MSWVFDTAWGRGSCATTGRSCSPVFGRRSSGPSRPTVDACIPTGARSGCPAPWRRRAP